MILTKTNLPRTKEVKRPCNNEIQFDRMTEELEERPLEDGKMELQTFQVVPGTGISPMRTEFGFAPVVHYGHSTPKECNPKGQVPGVMDIHGILGYHRDMT